jgi:hypothetical protein
VSRSDPHFVGEIIRLSALRTIECKSPLYLDRMKLQY